MIMVSGVEVGCRNKSNMPHHHTAQRRERERERERESERASSIKIRIELCKQGRR
jgi:hypothetical protein